MPDRRHPIYALDERIAEAGATSLWFPPAGPAESAVATVPTDETVELPKAPVKDWSQAVQNMYFRMRSGTP